jgi:hypothetical protein
MRQLSLLLALSACSSEVELNPLDNVAPAATLTSPADGTVLDGGTEVVVRGLLTDENHDRASLTYVFESLGVTLCEGSVADAGGDVACAIPLDDDATSLEITLVAEDPEGAVGSDSRTWTIAPVEAPVDPPNRAPGVDDVSILPAEPRVGDTASCVVAMSDPDGDELTVTFVWSDGSTGPDRPITVDDEPGDPLTCTATVSDGQDQAVGSETVHIVNTPPTVTAALDPDPAVNDDALTCTAEAFDADGDSPIVALAWSDADGTPLGTDATLDLATTGLAGGDAVTCTASATDPHGGTATVTATLTLGNRAPDASGLTVAPTPLRTDDTAIAALTASDADGDPLLVTYEWLVDGTLVASGPDAALDGTQHFDRGQTVHARATVSDGTDSAVVTSAVVPVVNTDPLVTASVTPDVASTVGPVTCAAAVTDADGDDAELTWVWTHTDTGDVVGDAATLSTTGLGLVLGDTLRCTVTADDGHGGVVTATADVPVGNEPAVVSLVALAPVPVHTDDVLLATPTVMDPDGDALTITYHWSAAGSAVETGASNALDGAVHFDKGDQVFVRVHAFDGLVTAIGASGILVVANTPPTAPGIALTPAAPTAGDDLHCDVTTPATTPTAIRSPTPSPGRSTTPRSPARRPGPRWATPSLRRPSPPARPGSAPSPPTTATRWVPPPRRRPRPTATSTATERRTRPAAAQTATTTTPP